MSAKTEFLFAPNETTPELITTPSGATFTQKPDGSLAPLYWHDDHHRLCVALAQGLKATHDPNQTIDQIIAITSSHEQASTFTIKEFWGSQHGIAIPGTHGLTPPDILYITPPTRLHLIQPSHKALAPQGEVSMSPGFSHCNALIALLRDPQNLFFQHVFPQPFEFVDAAQDLKSQTTQSNPEITVIAKDPLPLAEVLAHTIPEARINIGTVNFDSFFRVWAILNEDGHPTIKVTEDNPSNNPISVPLIPYQQ